MAHLLAEGKSVFYTGVAWLRHTAVQDAPTALVGQGTIQALQFTLIGLGLLGSLYAAYRIARANHAEGKVLGTFLPYAALMVLLGVMNVLLFVLPMKMRM